MPSSHIGVLVPVQDTQLLFQLPAHVSWEVADDTEVLGHFCPCGKPRGNFEFLAYADPKLPVVANEKISFFLLIYSAFQVY